ncbi:uncharacterized protein C3orf38 homolog [Parasteatoda tepidariorum]|uniref:uncharacterized protein C3orf38 homolog n=1 Tax=Parasteatoda tepidariorum TaxID=114398 RepID=UPI001C71BB33|nr:uncharacterized protein C3orf38 homolog [Parasteatoda tepidariorum]
MLSPAEKYGLENLLEELESEDLFSLFHTITKGRIRGTKNRSEAITTILSCIEKPTEVLKRQKITIKVLSSYLRKLCGSISLDNSRLELIDRCLQEWKSTDTSRAMDCWEPEKEETETPSKSVIPTKQESSLDEQLFGVRFIKWFFPLLNQLQDFGVEHFWQDAMLKAYIVSPFENEDLDIGSDCNTVNFLTNLIAHYKFSFLPNDSSVQCKQEAHGLIKISVKGTVHQHNNNPIGLFEFLFGLIRNPEYENNYKIKQVLLSMNVNVAFKNLLPST